MGMDSIVLTSLVTLSCGNIQDTSDQSAHVKNACLATIEAAARQSGAYATIKREEDRFAAKAEDIVRKHMNTTSIEVMSVMILTGRLLGGSNTTFRLGKGKFGESYMFETNTRDYYFRIGWDL